MAYGDCKYCCGANRLEIHRRNNIKATQCYVCKCEGDTDGTIVIENTLDMPAYIDINYCPMCGKKLSK